LFAWRFVKVREVLVCCFDRLQTTSIPWRLCDQKRLTAKDPKKGRKDLKDGLEDLVVVAKRTLTKSSSNPRRVCRAAPPMREYRMQKSSTFVVITFTAALMLLGNALAQQTPATTTSPASAAKTTTTPAKKAATKPAAKSATPLALKTIKDKASYAIGLNIGKSLHHDSVEVDPSILARGLKDGMAGNKSLLTDDEIKATMTALKADVDKRQGAKMQQQGEANKKEGDAFLAANKSKEGVVTLASGLQYKILKAGTGPKPAASDSVVCNYKGTFLNGTEFDSSYKRGQPATFPVSGVIKGWTEALQLMPVGSKWQLFIPSELAYGQHGPAEIGVNSTLIFEVELLSVQDKKDDKK
jgi:FKBP-type peptidyl-prolyl cis-trans isomerase FklB